MIAPYRENFDFLRPPIFWKVLKWPWNRQKLTYFKNDQNRSWDMSQGPLCPNLSQKVQKEVSQMANRNLSHVILLGGLSVNLNHLKITITLEQIEII